MTLRRRLKDLSMLFITFRYDTSLSRSPLSAFYARRQTTQLVINAGLNKHYAEAKRMQNWAFLDQVCFYLICIEIPADNDAIFQHDYD